MKQSYFVIIVIIPFLNTIIIKEFLIFKYLLGYKLSFFLNKFHYLFNLIFITKNAIEIVLI